MLIRLDRAAFARVAPLGASLVVHIALGVAAAAVVPRASARIAEVIAVDLVVIEPPAAPPAPAPPTPPKRITPPKPLATPLPTAAPPLPAPSEPRVEPTPSAPPPAATPPPPVATPRPSESPAPTAAAPTTAPSSTRADAGPTAPAVSRPSDAMRSEPGVSWIDTAPRPNVASVPPDAGVTRVAVPTGGYQVRPGYPSSAKRLGIQGTTLLRVHVLEDGRVGAVDVEQSAGHPDLDQAASNAVRRWRFEPARRGEQAIAMWVRLPVEFRLK